jgi:cadmium resistance protein CadD (predicted permease)
MNVHLTVLAASLCTFAVTNVDDICLLTLYFARRVPARRVVAGQYIGFSAIILLSLIGALAALVIPQGWSRLLGVLPLALGIRELYQRALQKTPTSKASGCGVMSIALITLSNGADNVGVYVPFFVANLHHLWLILTCYGLLVGMWCRVGRGLGSHSAVLRVIDRWGHWLMPIVLIGVGVYILLV